jgi:hypothetical protein
MFNKKSYFLTIDAFVAVGIVVLGVIIINSQFSFQTYDTQHDIYSKDILNSLIMPLPEYNVQYYETIKEYKEKGYFHNASLSLIEHIARFVVLNGTTCPDCFERSQNLTLDVIRDRIPNDYSVNISISNSTNYILYNNISVSFDEAKTVSMSQKMVIVIENNEFHPFIVKVVVWS